CQQGYTDPLTF
nr:immunoglobulin light chain junction region [Macaca mulatta]